jgi:membrane protein involved in colicin uptake
MRSALLVISCFSLIVCNSAPEGPSPEQKAAAEEKKAEEAALAARKAEREAEKKAEQEAESARMEAIEKLAVLPPEFPKKLDAACGEMLEAYDQFMRKVLTGDQKTKWETGGNEMQLAVFKKGCLERNVETAACQANALSNAPPEMETQLGDIMTRCAQKHGAKAASGRPPGK